MISYLTVLDHRGRTLLLALHATPCLSLTHKEFVTSLNRLSLTALCQTRGDLVRNARKRFTDGTVMAHVCLDLGLTTARCMP